MDICRPKQWGTISLASLTETGYPVYGANGKIGFYPKYNHEKPTLLITCRGATCGEVNICEPFSYVTGNAMCLDELDADVDLSFLYYLLKKRGFQDVISGTAQPQITRENLSYVDLFLPPLPEQRRLAALLAKADRLRHLRRTATHLGETYLQSVFVEMFGEPLKNKKGWGKTAISDLGQVITGNTPSREESENFGNFIEWIKSDNIVDGQLYVSQSREMLSQIGSQKGRSVDSGAVLMTCIAGSLNHIGDVALTNRNVAFNQQINAIAPNEDMNPLFLYVIFHLVKPYIQFNATAGMKHIITKSKLEELTLIKPPLAEQERFAAIVRRYERLRAQGRESARQGEQLFQSLLAQAFG